eukprot:6536943-Prorocentrum_lima.AAC.1
MTSSLVGSEMCIRDRSRSGSGSGGRVGPAPPPLLLSAEAGRIGGAEGASCLLYTSDAADDM